MDEDMDPEGDAGMGVFGILVAMRRVIDSPLPIKLYS